MAWQSWNSIHPDTACMNQVPRSRRTCLARGVLPQWGKSFGPSCCRFLASILFWIRLLFTAIIESRPGGDSIELQSYSLENMPCKLGPSRTGLTVRGGLQSCWKLVYWQWHYDLWIGCLYYLCYHYRPYIGCLWTCLHSSALHISYLKCSTMMWHYHLYGFKIFQKITLNLGFRLSAFSLYTLRKSAISWKLFFSWYIYLYTLLFILSLSQARTDKKNLNILDLHSFIDFKRLL